MTTDADLMATLAPHFPPEMDEQGKAHALSWYKELGGKSLEQLAVLLAIQQRITETATSLLAAAENKALKSAKSDLVTTASKIIYGPNGQRRHVN